MMNTRVMAKAKGHKYYKTGNKCKHGNREKRATSDGKCQCPQCKEDKAEYNRKRRKGESKIKTKDKNFPDIPPLWRIALGLPS